MRRLLRAKPRDPEVDAYVRSVNRALRETTATLVELVRANVPDSRETLHHGTPKFCAGSELFCYVAAHPGHVRLGFFEGVFLDDPLGLLRGDGKQLRHVSVEPGAIKSKAALVKLIRGAARRASP